MSFMSSTVREGSFVVYWVRPWCSTDGSGSPQGRPPLLRLNRRWQTHAVVSTNPPSINHLGLWRRQDRRWIAGVAGGVADRIGVPDLYVRAAFVTLTTIWGLGLALYLFLWWLTLEQQAEPVEGRLDAGQKAGLALIFVSAIWIMIASGFVPEPFTTIVIGAISFGFAAALDRSESGGIARLILPGGNEGISVLRLVAGVTLLLGGLGLFFGTNRVTASMGGTFIAIALTVVGLAVAFGPLFVRMRDDLDRERVVRARQEEREEMAAHLHDSVLQTLALIQRTDDPKRMSSLARAQERELRTWLFGKAPLDGTEVLSTALAASVARIEDERGTPIELVVVGDSILDDRGSGLVAAASEAVVNAVKHSGAERVSVYLEVSEGKAEVWVTDQGVGFERGQAVRTHRRADVRAAVLPVGVDDHGVPQLVLDPLECAPPGAPGCHGQRRAARSRESPCPPSRHAVALPSRGDAPSAPRARARARRVLRL